MDDSRGVGLDVASISGILTRIDILTGKAVVEEFVIRQHMAHVASLVLNGDVVAVGSYIQTNETSRGLVDHGRFVVGTCILSTNHQGIVLKMILHKVDQTERVGRDVSTALFHLLHHVGIDELTAVDEFAD